MKYQHLSVPVHSKGLDHLASRGIRPGLRGNPRSQNHGITSILLRLDRLAATTDLEARLGAENFRLATALLSNPWSLSASDIETLPTHFRQALKAPAVALPFGFDPVRFLEQVSGLDYADRLALVCSAEQYHATAST